MLIPAIKNTFIYFDFPQLGIINYHSLAPRALPYTIDFRPVGDQLYE